MIDTKMDLRPAIQTLATEDFNMITNIGIGHVLVDDFNNPYAHIEYSLDSLNNVSIAQLNEDDTNGDFIVLQYSNGTFDELDIIDVLIQLGLVETDCFICDKVKLCLPINVSDFDSYYKKFLLDGALVCEDCRKQLHNKEIKLCDSCCRHVVYDDGYCSDCY